MASSSWRTESTEDLAARTTEERLPYYQQAHYDGLGIDQVFLNRYQIQQKVAPYYKRAEKLLQESDVHALDGLATAILQNGGCGSDWRVRVVVLTFLGMLDVPEATAADLQRLVACDQNVLLSEKNIRILYRFSDGLYRIYAQKISCFGMMRMMRTRRAQAEASLTATGKRSRLKALGDGDPTEQDGVCLPPASSRRLVADHWPAASP